MRPIVSLLCMLLLLGCVSDKLEVTPTQFHHDFFFRLSTTEQIKQFHEYDQETQYELLIIGNQLVHPPALYLEDEFAKNGSTVVPALRSKLAATEQELTIRDIVAVFSEMQRLGSYDVKGDANLMGLVEERVAGMQGQWKSVAQKMLEEIQGYPQK